MRKYFALFSLLFPLFAQAFEKEDVGTYAIINKNGNTSNSTYDISNKYFYWNIEQKSNDGIGPVFSCQKGCRLNESSAKEIAAIVPTDVLQKNNFSCIQNKVLAFCSYSPKEDKTKKGYTLINLTYGPTPIFMRKISKEKVKSKGIETGSFFRD